MAYNNNNTAMHRENQSLAAGATRREFGGSFGFKGIQDPPNFELLSSPSRLQGPVTSRLTKGGIGGLERAGAQPSVESGHIWIDGVALAARTRYRSGGRARASLTRSLACWEGRAHRLGSRCVSVQHGKFSRDRKFLLN